ncbi:MAG: SlyX family protein [Treponema sp.]
MDEHERRLEAAEIKLAYMEDFVNQLQQAVLEQQAELDALKRENKTLAAKLGDIASLLDDDIPNRRPPHY